MHKQTEREALFARNYNQEGRGLHTQNFENLKPTFILGRGNVAAWNTFLILVVFNVDKTVDVMERIYSAMSCLTSSLFARVSGWTRDLDW
jgi:hypothetical protein